MTRIRSLLSLLALALAAPPVLANTPLVMTHSGYLLDAEDSPVNAEALDVTFTIYDTDTTSTLQNEHWKATCPVSVVRGYYSATSALIPVRARGSTSPLFLWTGRAFSRSASGARR